MSDKPQVKPSAANHSAKPDGGGSTPASKGAASTARSNSTAGQPDYFDFLSPPQMPDEVGRLAHYRVLKVLGKGGMGIVYMAEDTRLHRIVALKVMLPEVAKKEIARERFLREAQATAKIEHDHIITIYEVNSDHDIPYAAMQYLKGMTLEDWLRAGKTLNIPQIMRIGKEIAKGLAAAHARGLIHRDIKPSNIWLDAANKGRVKILDFGLARPTNEETHLTQEGMILGTPAYMSPEQARGENVDERCDLFSLGCVLYRLCAGRLPFIGKDAMSMLVAIINEQPPDVQPLNSEVPPALGQLIHQLLSKKPGDRPASAKDVVQAIQNIERDWVAGGKTVTTRAPKLGVNESLSSEPTIDPSLEESAITEQELQGAQAPGAARTKRHKQSWVIAGLLGAAFAVLSIVCCLGIAIATDHGDLQIIAEDADVRALLTDESLKVYDHHKTAHPVKVGPNRLRSGGYEFDLSALPVNLLVEPSNQFNVVRGEAREVRFKLKSSKGPPPPLVLVTSDQARRLQRDWASYLRVDVNEVGRSPQGPKLTLIPPGEFWMGSTDEQIQQQLNEFRKKFPAPDAKRLEAETPQHKVRISKPFYISTQEVTYENFLKFVVAPKGYVTEPEKKGGGGGTGIESGKETARRSEFSWKNTGYPQSKDHPLCNITLKDAEAYCRWLSQQEGKTYRLPTEAEWEYACRAGTTTLWFFGDDLKDSRSVEYMWFNLPGKIKFAPLTSHPTGKKKTNDFGLCDVHGNVAEMCSDYFDADYYKHCARDELTIDPRGPEPSPNSLRVVRGGSFLEPPQSARSAHRQSLASNEARVWLGFRVVCEIPMD